MNLSKGLAFGSMAVAPITAGVARAADDTAAVLGNDNSICERVS